MPATVGEDRDPAAGHPVSPNARGFDHGPHGFRDTQTCPDVRSAPAIVSTVTNTPASSSQVTDGFRPGLPAPYDIGSRADRSADHPDPVHQRYAAADASRSGVTRAA